MFITILYCYLAFSYGYIGAMILKNGNWKDDLFWWLISPVTLLAILFTNNKPKF